jgi:hypothetical protein
MPVIAPLTPAGLKAAFLRSGWEVVEEDDLNCAVAKPSGGPPLIVPKDGPCVSLEIMDQAVEVGGADLANEIIAGHSIPGHKPEHIEDIPDPADLHAAD